MMLSVKALFKKNNVMAKYRVLENRFQKMDLYASLS
jgi:hypothetical protein